jgi:hypothetical protein
MKIQITDLLEQYNIETIDLTAYDLESEEDIELMKNDLANIILSYVEENI